MMKFLLKLLTTFSPFLLFSQESDSLLLDFSFKKGNYGIFEMLEFKISIKNAGSEPIEMFHLEEEQGENLRIASFDSLHMEYRKNRASKWKWYADIPKVKYDMDFRAYEFNYFQLPPNKMILSGWLAIKPGHKGDWGKMWKPEPERLLIDKQGDYEFRLCGSYLRKKFSSNTKKIFVSRKKGKNAKKIRSFLNQTPKPYFLHHMEYRLMSYPSNLDMNDTLLVPYAKHFLEKFPQSDLAPLANLFLAKCYYLKIDIMSIGQEFIDKNINTLRDIKIFCEKCRSYSPPKHIENGCIYLTDNLGLLILISAFKNDIKAMKSSDIGKEFPIDY